MKRTILKRRLEIKTSDQVNFSRINGFLSCMETLNNGPEHLCLYEFSPVEQAGNRRESLIEHLNEATHLDISENIKHWNWEVRLIKAEQPVEMLSLVANKYFFEQKYSSKPACNTAVAYFLNMLMEETNYYPLKVYEAITTVDNIWHEIWWADFLIDAGGELFHLHFGATN